MGSIRLMSLAARFRMNIHQLDVTTAFLNGHLEEDILVNPPKESIELLQILANSDKDEVIRKKANQMLHELNTSNKVCKLRKALYELRQSWTKLVSTKS